MLHTFGVPVESYWGLGWRVEELLSLRVHGFFKGCRCPNEGPFWILMVAVVVDAIGDHDSKPDLEKCLPCFDTLAVVSSEICGQPSPNKLARMLQVTNQLPF